jgi:PAS domain S-box-containing protein
LFLTGHLGLGESYRRGLETLVAGAEPRDIDRQVMGLDRPLSRLLDRVSLDIGSDADQCRLSAGESINARFRLGLIIGSCLWLVLLGAALGFGWLLTRPILELSRFARSVQTEKDYSARAPVRGRDEVADLGRAINDMMEEVRLGEDRLQRRGNDLEERTRELARQEARTRSILEGAADAIFSVDAAGLIQSANPSAERMFGVPASEFSGNRFEMFVRKTWKSVGNSSDAAAAHESVGRRADGTDFPLEVTLRECRAGDEVMVSVIVRDATERKKIDRMKNEFISTVSHELRTPLTSIRGSLGLALSGIAGPLVPKLKGMIEIASKNCDRLVRLVNDILDIQKIEAGKMPFKIRPLDLGALVGQSVEANMAFAQSLGVGIDVVGSAPSARVMGDSDRLLQVLTNLISNACKFSPAGRKVEVSLSRIASAVRVSVRDQGQGISEEFRSRVFRKFAQADASDSRQKGGTGLGLSICKAIVEKLGGSIGFESETGKGSTFFFDLPAEEAPVATAPSAAAGRPTILVCEDESDVATVLRETLEASGFSVDVADSARAAKERLVSGKIYTAMTLDLMLPDQNGISLVHELREEARTRHLPIIIVSAYLDEGKSLLSGGSFGIVDWLEKPIDEVRLQVALRRVVDRDGSRRKSILHVEDDPDLQQVIAAMLRDVADVVAVASLKEAKEWVATRTPDLVILDLGLPDGSGLDLIPHLQRTRKAFVPVMVFTAQEPTVSAARSVAATLLKSKVSNEDLVSRIRSMIGCGSMFQVQEAP